MKAKSIYIWVILLLPIIGFSQIITPNDTAKISNSGDSILNKRQILENRWGEQLTTALQKAQKVEVFHLESFKTDDLTMPNLEGFFILNKAILNKIEEQEFQNLITDTATYYLEKSAKQCLFMPKMGVQLTTENDTVNVLFSLKCDLIRFYFKGEMLTLNADDGRVAILDYFSKAFPKAVFIQSENLSAKSSKPIIYKVQSNDNWFKIHQTATQNYNQNTTIEDLYQWNNIPENKRNDLKIGTEVIIGFE
jgi:hypothetical protein